MSAWLENGNDLEPIASTLVKAVFNYQESVLKNVAPAAPSSSPDYAKASVQILRRTTELLLAQPVVAGPQSQATFHSIVGQTSTVVHRSPAFLSSFLMGFSDPALIDLYESSSTDSYASLIAVSSPSSPNGHSKKLHPFQVLSSSFSPGHVVVLRRIESLDFAGTPLVQIRHYVWCPSLTSFDGEGRLLFFDDPATLDAGLLGPGPAPLRVQEALEEIARHPPIYLDSESKASDDDCSGRGGTCGFFDFVKEEYDQTTLTLTQKVLLDATQYLRADLKSVLRLEFSLLPKLRSLLDRGAEVDALQDEAFRKKLRNAVPLSADEKATISRSIKHILLDPATPIEDPADNPDASGRSSSNRSRNNNNNNNNNNNKNNSNNNGGLPSSSEGTDTPTPSTSKSAAAVQRIVSNLSVLTSEVADANPWRRARRRRDPVVSVVQKSTRKSKGGNVLMRGVVQVHESPETVLSWLTRFCSEERRMIAAKDNPGANLPRINIDFQGMRSSAQCSVVKSIPPFESRVFENLVLWSTLSEAHSTEHFDLSGGISGGYLMCFDPLPPTFGRPQSWVKDKKVLKCVRAWTKGMYIIQRVALHVSRVTLIQQVVLGGFVPLALSAYAMSHMERGMQRMYGRYQRAGSLIDHEIRDEFITTIDDALADTSTQTFSRTSKSRQDDCKKRCNALKAEWDLAMASLHDHSENDDDDGFHGSKTQLDGEANRRRAASADGPEVVFTLAPSRGPRFSNRISFKKGPLIKSLSLGGTSAKPLKMNFKNAPFVDLWMRKPNTSDVSSKVVAVIDTSAESYIAAVFDHCSNRRQTRMKLEHCVARSNMEFFTLPKNERVFATVLSIPSTDVLVETVTRAFWTYEGMDVDDREGFYLVYVESVDVPANYEHFVGSAADIRSVKVVGLHIVQRLFSHLCDADGRSNQCRVTYLQTLSAGNNKTTTALLLKSVPITNFFIEALRIEFQKDAKVDAEDIAAIKKQMLKAEGAHAVLEKAAKETGSTNGLLLHEEDSMSFERTNKKFMMLRVSSKLRPIESVYPGVKCDFFSPKDGSGSHIFFARAELVVDASIEEVASFDFVPWGRQRLQRFYETGGVSRRIIRRNIYSLRNQSEINLFIPGLSHRRFEVLTVWRKTDEDTIVITNEPYSDHFVGGVDESERSSSAKSSSRSSQGKNSASSMSKLWTATTFSRMAKSGGALGFDQTKITYLVTADLGFLIPKIIQSSIAWKRFGFLNTFISEFTKSDEVDMANARRIYEEIVGVGDDDLSLLPADAADAMIGVGKRHDNDPLLSAAQQLIKETRAASRLNAPRFSPFLAVELASDDGHHSTFVASGTARASVADVLGFVLNYEAKAYGRMSDVSRTVVERDVKQKYQVVQLLELSADRKSAMWLSTKLTWRKVGGGGNNNEGSGYVVIAENVNMGDAAFVPLDSTKQLLARGSSITTSSSNRLAKQISLQTISKGSTIRSVINIVSSSSETTYVEIFYTAKSKQKNGHRDNQEVNMVSDMLESLFRRRREQELSSVDGASLGAVFGNLINSNNSWFLASKNQRMRDGIDSIFLRHASLKGLSKTDEWLKPMVYAFLGANDKVEVEAEEGGWFSYLFGGWVRGYSRLEKESTQQRRSIPLRVSCLDADDGDFVGAALWEHIENAANHNLAVESWIKDFPALKEFSLKHPFFEPMMKEIAKVEVTKLTPGKLYECVKKTCMSVLDLATDVLAVRIFTSYGQATIATILTSIIFTAIVFQIACCVLIHHRNFKFMTQEIFYCLFCLKSGINHYRVITKSERRGHELVDSSIEKAIFTSIDLTIESIPGTIIQVYAFLRFFRSYTWASYVSTAVGVLFAALSTLYLDMPKDRDPNNRAMSPLFYGLLPDVGGKLVPVCMVVMFATQLLMKALLYAILSTLGPWHLVVFAGSEWLLFLLFKIARKDYGYWLKIQGAVLPHLITFLFRLTVKIMTDFVCMFQLRHCFEVGGAYWLFSATSAHVALGVVLSVADLSHLEVSHDLLSKIALSCVLLWWAAFAGVLRMCNKDYVRTFFDTRTGAEFSRDSFFIGDDISKASYATDNRCMLKLYEKELALWLEEGWNTWEVTRPTWFTDAWKAGLPQDLRPEDSFR